MDSPNFFSEFRFSELFLGILLSEFRFTVFLPLDCGDEGYHEELRETPSYHEGAREV